MPLVIFECCKNARTRLIPLRSFCDKILSPYFQKMGAGTASSRLMAHSRVNVAPGGRWMTEGPEISARALAEINVKIFFQIPRSCHVKSRPSDFDRKKHQNICSGIVGHKYFVLVGQKFWDRTEYNPLLYFEQLVIESRWLLCACLACGSGKWNGKRLHSLNFFNKF